MYKIEVNDPHFLPHSEARVEIPFDKGELIALVGENGVGKTTLAQRFYRENLSLTSLLEQKPLDYFYDRTLGDIKKIFLDSGKGNIDESFFTHYWKAFNLSQKEDRFQSSLSGGEGQALKLCLGLSLNKDIYILDEPGQYLDMNAKGILKKMIERLITSKKGVIIIEHNLEWIDLPLTVHQLVIKDKVLQREKTWTI